MRSEDLAVDDRGDGHAEPTCGHVEDTPCTGPACAGRRRRRRRRRRTPARGGAATGTPARGAAARPRARGGSCCRDGAATPAPRGRPPTPRRPRRTWPVGGSGPGRVRRRGGGRVAGALPSRARASRSRRRWRRVQPAQPIGGCRDGLRAGLEGLLGSVGGPVLSFLGCARHGSHPIRANGRPRTPSVRTIPVSAEPEGALRSGLQRPLKRRSPGSSPLCRAGAGGGPR